MEADAIIKECIDLIINEYQKEGNRRKIELNVLDPIVNYIGQQLWPYILTVSIMMFIVFILVFYLVYKTSYVSSIKS